MGIEVEFITVYQPIIDVKQNKIIGFEANTRGKLYGKDDELNYMELKKENIINLDFIARDKALTEFNLKNYRLFVNAEPEELKNPIFFEDIDLSNVVLEITEGSTILPDDIERTHLRLKLLRETKGLSIALDDVGAKYSNIDKINEYKPEYLKIDKDAAKNEFNIVKGYIQSEYEVIIEGIEEKDEFRKWVDAGCQYLQGYYISKPLQYHELTQAIASGELKEHISQILFD